MLIMNIELLFFDKLLNIYEKTELYMTSEAV